MIRRPRSQRFSLLLLQEGEYYFEDCSAYYLPAGGRGSRGAPCSLAAASQSKWAPTHDPTPTPRLKGRLKVCSGSLMFDPEDVRLPITKFAFRDVQALNKWESPLIERGAHSISDAFVIRCDLVVEMKENGIDHPYRFCKGSHEHRFSLNYVSLSSFLPRVMRLLSGSPHDIRQVIEEHEASIEFDPTWLGDLSENALHEWRCSKITPLEVMPGRLMVTDRQLYFQAFNNTAISPVEKYQLSAIVRIVKRRHMLRHVGLEFVYEGTAVLLAFSDREQRDACAQLVSSEPATCSLQSGDHANMTLRWQNGDVSNYDYLIYLNSMADRTFNDLTQYPVFPWVVADYTSSKLDLTRSETFRRLDLPIGALNKERLAMFRERYNQMPDDPALPRFLYGTHYSTPGYVLYYLVRQAPDYMLRLQNGRFDTPDRLFNSLSDCWTGVLVNPTDLKELVPEFYQPSNKGGFLQNSQDLDLGTCQSGRRVGDVTLPPWASTPFDFVAKLREALESDWVSERLHMWIDLIFGYKQQGKAAIDADNLFYFLTYEGAVDIERETDPMKRAALEMQVAEFGQTPTQLFRTPHPPRHPRELRGMASKLPPAPATLAAVESLMARGSSPVPHSPKPKAAAMSPFKRPSSPPVEIASGADEKGVWGSLQSMNLLFSKKLHRDSVTDLCLSPDGKTLFTVGQDCALKLFSLTEQRQMRSAQLGDLALSSCALGPQGKTILVGSWDNKMYLYSVDYGRILDTVGAHDDAVSCLAWPRPNLLATGSWDSSIKLWSCSTNGVEHVPSVVLSEHETEVKCIAVDPSGDLLLSGSMDGVVALWDTRAGKHIRSLDAHNDAVSSLRFTPDGRRFVSSSLDGTLRVWEAGGGCVDSIPCDEPLRCAITDGFTVMTGSESGRLRTRLLSNGEDVTPDIVHQNKHRQPVACLCAGETFVSGDDGGTVMVWR